MPLLRYVVRDARALTQHLPISALLYGRVEGGSARWLPSGDDPDKQSISGSHDCSHGGGYFTHVSEGREVVNWMAVRRRGLNEASGERKE